MEIEDINQVVDYEEEVEEVEIQKGKREVFLDNKIHIDCLTIVENTNIGGIDNFGEKGFLEFTSSTDSGTVDTLVDEEEDDEDDFKEFDDVPDDEEQNQFIDNSPLNPAFRNKIDQQPVACEEFEPFDIFDNFDRFDPQEQIEKELSVEKQEKPKSTTTTTTTNPLKRDLSSIIPDIPVNGKISNTGFNKNKKVAYENKSTFDPFFTFDGYEIPYYEFPHIDFFCILSMLRYCNPFDIKDDDPFESIISKRVDKLSDICMSIFNPNPINPQDFNPKMRYMFNSMYNTDSMDQDKFQVDGYVLFYKQIVDDPIRKAFFDNIKRVLHYKDELFDEFLSDQSLVNAIFRLLIIKKCFMVVYDSNKEKGLENLSSLCFDHQFDAKKTRAEGKKKESFLYFIGLKIKELVEDLSENKNKFNDSILIFINEAIKATVFDFNVKNFFLKSYVDSFGIYKLNVDLFGDRLSLSRSLFDKTICNTFSIFDDINKKSTFFAMINKKIIEQQKLHVYMNIQSELLKSSTNLIFSEFSDLVFQASISNLKNSLIEYPENVDDLQSYIDDYWLSLLSKTLSKIGERIKTNSNKTSSFSYLLKNINFYIIYIKKFIEEKKKNNKL